MSDDMPKQDSTLDTVYRMRMRSEQKTLLSLASASADADNMSEFWRDYSVYSAELILKYQAGEITAEEYGELIAEYIEKRTATVEQDEP